MTNIAVFASGNGSNCENIIRFFNGNNDIKVNLVICNNPKAYVIQRAEKLGVECQYLRKDGINNEQTMTEVLDRHNINFIVLAGFLLMIPQFLIKKYNHRIMNIHPSLLPKFGGKGMYGHHVHEAVKAAGETVTGITIHFVTEVCDGGEIIAQFQTPLSPQDTAEDIEAKVHVLEMNHFPHVIEETVKRINGGNDK